MKVKQALKEMEKNKVPAQDVVTVDMRIQGGRELIKHYRTITIDRSYIEYSHNTNRWSKQGLLHSKTLFNSKT